MSKKLFRSIVVMGAAMGGACGGKEAAQNASVPVPDSYGVAGQDATAAQQASSINDVGAEGSSDASPAFIGPFDVAGGAPRDAGCDAGDAEAGPDGVCPCVGRGCFPTYI